MFVYPILLLQLALPLLVFYFGFCPAHAYTNFYIATSSYNPPVSQTVFPTCLVWIRPQLSQAKWYLSRKSRPCWLPCCCDGRK